MSRYLLLLCLGSALALAAGKETAAIDQAAGAAHDAVVAACGKDGFAESSAEKRECIAQRSMDAWVACGKDGFAKQSRAEAARMIEQNSDPARTECTVNRLLQAANSNPGNYAPPPPSPAATAPTPRQQVPKELDIYSDPSKLSGIAAIFLKHGDDTGLRWLELAHAVRSAQWACGQLGFADGSVAHYDCIETRTHEARERLLKETLH